MLHIKFRLSCPNFSYSAMINIKASEIAREIETEMEMEIQIEITEIIEIQIMEI